MMKDADHHLLQLTPQALYSFRIRLKRGLYPRDETMRALLDKAGWSKVMEERWAK